MYCVIVKLATFPWKLCTDLDFLLLVIVSASIDPIAFADIIKRK